MTTDTTVPVTEQENTEPECYDPRQHIMDMGWDSKTGKRRQYLPVFARLKWLRDKHPDACILSEHILAEPEWAIFKTTISYRDEKGERIVANGYGSETIKEFNDYIEKAETRALGRALAHLGYGTEDAIESEPSRSGNPRIVDAPVERPGVRPPGPPSPLRPVGPRPAPVAQAPRPTPPAPTPTPTEDAAALHKFAQEAETLAGKITEATGEKAVVAGVTQAQPPARPVTPKQPPLPNDNGQAEQVRPADTLPLKKLPQAQRDPAVKYVREKQAEAGWSDEKIHAWIAANLVNANVSNIPLDNLVLELTLPQMRRLFHAMQDTVNTPPATADEAPLPAEALV